MSATREAIADLLREGALEQVPIDPEVVGHLQRQAGNHLRTARAGAGGGDPEGAFRLAYDACRKLCLALLLAAGFRPRGDKGHHAITFEGAATLATSFGQRKIVNEASDLRYVRNSTEYRAETVDLEDTIDAIAMGEVLLTSFAEPIRKLLENAAS